MTKNVSVDASGALLHRRGYRLATAKAPMRETLAAAAGVFLPVYLFVVVLAPLFERLSHNDHVRAFVRGVTAVATGSAMARHRSPRRGACIVRRTTPKRSAPASKWSSRFAK